MPKTCCRREILILLLWWVLFRISRDLLINTAYIRGSSYLAFIIRASGSVSPLILAPFIGWLADVKLGRYKVIIYGTLASFGASIPFTVAQFSGETLGEVLYCIGNIVDTISSTGFSAAMLPFMTDQLVGATANELSAVVYWYFWFMNLSWGFVDCITCTNSFFKATGSLTLNVIVVVPCAALLVAIIISDCLCQQWLDRSYKITNPIKLIIQVLNYARQHSYPQKRSAFTYMDEEQPSRLDFGKEKFGGPFSEEEVEDVKTVLRLLPLIICISISVSSMLWPVMHLNAFGDQYMYINCVLNFGARDWIAPLLLIPLYQFLLYPLFHKWVPSMLRRIGAGLFLQLVGFVLFLASLIMGYSHAGDLTEYLTCTKAVNGTVTPDQLVEWYWKLKLVPMILYSVGRTLADVLLLELVIAQSPDKMKGFVFGMILAFASIGNSIGIVLTHFFLHTLCFDIPVLLLLTILFLVFLFFSKYYKLRERNKEVNIQAIVEEHYEKYMDQEEEYMREHPDLYSETDT